MCVCELDTNTYPKGIVVSDEKWPPSTSSAHEFHGEWNYTIKPSDRSDRAVDP